MAQAGVQVQVAVLEESASKPAGQVYSVLESSIRTIEVEQEEGLSTLIMKDIGENPVTDSRRGRSAPAPNRLACACFAGLVAVLVLGAASSSPAVTNLFFNPYQTATVVTTNMTSTTIRSRGYLFTYSVEGWWSAYPGGPPTGRLRPVLWPAGVDAQTITADAAGPVPQQISASITITRADSQPFDLRTFTGIILGNTAGAGAAFELMPQLNGNDAFANPLTYDATGYAGQSFSYAPMLTGYDTYVLSLWMDYALTQLAVADAGVITQPQLQISNASSNSFKLLWPTNAPDFTLLQNSNLVANTWGVVTNAAAVVGTNSQVLVPGANGAHFFRLVF